MSRIQPARFVHVVYRTRQFEKMIDWYRTVFDAKVQHQDPVLAFVTYDDEHHRFAFINLSAVDPEGQLGDTRGARGVDHVAYTFASLRELLENHAQLKELGITPYWSLHHGITISLYYADPDGNQMEFQVDCLDNDAANAFMAGAGFGQNPIGVEFEPDAWLAALRNGQAESDYLPRTVHQPVSPIRGNLFGH
jgi:catechol 2,3-dioxygenase-like lactoylglutathione lyase family enzyme